MYKRGKWPRGLGKERLACIKPFGEKDKKKKKKKKAEKRQKREPITAKIAPPFARLWH